MCPLAKVITCTFSEMLQAIWVFVFKPPFVMPGITSVSSSFDWKVYHHPSVEARNSPVSAGWPSQLNYPLSFPFCNWGKSTRVLLAVGGQTTLELLCWVKRLLSTGVLHCLPIQQLFIFFFILNLFYLNVLTWWTAVWHCSRNVCSSTVWG